MNKNEEYMLVAIAEAKKSLKHGDIPVGAVLVLNGKIVAKAHNTRKQNKDIAGHAEISSVNKAIKKLKNPYLDDCTLYVTMEPCLMCYGAIDQTNICKIYYAVENENYGYTKYINRIPKIEVVSGICKDEVKKMLSDFFRNKRD